LDFTFLVNEMQKLHFKNNTKVREADIIPLIRNYLHFIHSLQNIFTLVSSNPNKPVWIVLFVFIYWHTHSWDCFGELMETNLWHVHPHFSIYFMFSITVDTPESGWSTVISQKLHSVAFEKS
jgi:hypothetical protein